MCDALVDGTFRIVLTMRFDASCPCASCGSSSRQTRMLSNGGGYLASASSRMG